MAAPSAAAAEVAASIYEDPFRLLAVIIVLVLLMLFAAVWVATRRGERVERKVDAIGSALGIAMHFEDLDREYGRRSSHAPLHAADGREGGSSRSPRHWETPGPAGYRPPPPPPPRPRD